MLYEESLIRIYIKNFCEKMALTPINYIWLDSLLNVDVEFAYLNLMTSFIAPLAAKI